MPATQMPKTPKMPKIVESLTLLRIRFFVFLTGLQELGIKGAARADSTMKIQACLGKPTILYAWKIMPNLPKVTICPRPRAHISVHGQLNMSFY
jgi:hypothetical protein